MMRAVPKARQPRRRLLSAIVQAAALLAAFVLPSPLPAKLQWTPMQESNVARAAAASNVGPAAWLSAACAPAGAAAPRIEGRARDGRVAALVESEGGAGVVSHLLLADAGGTAWQDVAVFEARVEAMEWQGMDLLLAFAADQPMRVFSVFPGMRLRDASGPGAWRWLRISTRRSRR
jgi:hypothetical protein